MSSNVIQFHITKDGSWYTANCISLPIVTQAKTLDKLIRNMREATKLYFEDAKPSDLGYSNKPSLLANFELDYVS